MSIENFGLFALAAFLLNITPGNDFIYVATRSLSQGIRAGIISSLGIGAGLIIHVSVSVLGLSAILAKSAFAFNLIKYIGAGYLIYVGIKMIFSKTISPDEIKTSSEKKNSSWIIFRQGFFTNVFNPKVALFFLSFLPQFADMHSPYFSSQLALLGAWFIFSGTLVSIAIALIFGKLRNWLSSFHSFWKLQQKIAGTVLIVLGLKIAFMQRHLK